MAEALFRVRQAGPLVTWQDAGRPGLMRYGVPASGPMDRGAFAIAQTLLANPPLATAIEVSLGGLTLDCIAGEAAFAVAGGGFILDHQGQALSAWGRGVIRAGQSLRLRRGPWGSWCYLAFAGHIRGEDWLCARATHAPSGLGGGALRVGQEFGLDARPAPGPEWQQATCPVWARPRRILHVVPGPQDRFFPGDTIETFLTAPFRITDACDRMGLRLSGPALRPEGALGIPSEPILRGSVQVNGEGVATILMADHQTTGGYPKIATLADADLDGLAQCRPRDLVAFRAVAPDRALAMARQRARHMVSLVVSLRHRHARVAT